MYVNLYVILCILCCGRGVFCWGALFSSSYIYIYPWGYLGLLEQKIHKNMYIVCVSTKIYRYRPIFKVAKFVICNICTPSKTNVAPENGPLIKEDSYSKPSFLGSMIVYVSFRGLSDPGKKNPPEKNLWPVAWRTTCDSTKRSGRFSNTSSTGIHPVNTITTPPSWVFFYCCVSAGVAWPGCIRSNARIFAASIDSNNIGQPQLAIKSEVRFSGVIFSG